MERTILHIDMDAYFAAIEEKSNPFLAGKPVVVAGDPDSRTVVATANYKAREYGIKSGMPLKQALRLCPRAEVVVGNPAKYADTTNRLLGILKEFTHLVECDSIDEAFLDITDSQGRFGGEVETAREMKKRIRDRLGLSCSIGLAPNKLLAKLASDMEKPDGLVRIRQEDVPELMKGLPVKKLWGIGGKTAEKLNQLGIRTCRELAEYPEADLVAIFGVTGRTLHLMGLGEYDSEVRPFYREPEVKSMGHSYTLFRDTSRPMLVRSTLCRLCEQVGRRLRADNYQGKTVTLVVRLSDFTTLVRQKSLSYHTADGFVVYQTALAIMKTLNLSRPVRLVGVSVSGLWRQQQVPLFDRDRRRLRLLSQVDRINDKFGEFTVSPAMVYLERGGGPKEPAIGGIGYRTRRG